MKKQEKGITLIALIITIVVLLILAVVSIKAVQDGGIITHAQNAASKMNKAQIEEKANLTKLEYTTEVYTNKDLKKSVQEFRERLITAFEVTKDTNNDNIIEVNDKYAVVIKNTDLDIEVVEITNALKASSLVSLTYTTTNYIEDNGQPAIINLEILITKLMSLEDYGKLTVSDEATQEDKEKVVLDFYGNQLGTTFNNLDEALLYIVNYNNKTDFKTIDECLTTLGTTREQLYYSLYNNTDLNSDNTMSKEELINNLYSQVINNDDYNALTKKLSLYVKVNGGEEEMIKNSINPTATIKYKIRTNDKYEFILRTESGTEITREIMQIKNIIKTPYVLTTQEAQGVWTTNGRGTITKYTGNSTEVVVPIIIGEEEINTITPQTFQYSTNLTSVTMQDNITSIPPYAFRGCTNLKDISLPEGITFMPAYAFAECSSLMSIEIPKSVVGFAAGAFENCISLKEVVIPEGLAVDSNSNYIFRNCTSLESITLSENTEYLADSLFENCTSLKNIVIPKNVIYIPSATFKNCTSLSEIEIQSEKLISVGYQSFKGCTSLTSITLPENTKIIAESAFADCTNLTSVTMEGVTEIRGLAFWGCTSLTSITLPESVITIESLTFSDCTSLTSIYFKGEIPEGRPWGAPNENTVIEQIN